MNAHGRYIHRYAFEIPVKIRTLNSVSRGRPLVQGTFVFDSLICIGNCLLNLYCENAHVNTVGSA